MFKPTTLFTILLLLANFAFAQTLSISGTVSDDKETIPGAAIYISGTKIVAVSNNQGQFTLGNLPAGNYEILVQVVGFLPYNTNVLLTDRSVKLNIVLKAKPFTLNEVVIKPDPNRINYINLFKEFFIGTTPNAANCKIVNPEVLRVAYDKTDKLLTVSSDEFIIIENQALGYRIKYLLKNFEYSFNTHILFFAGYPVFEEMKGIKAKIKRWNNKRNLAYYGSHQHFFKALYAGNIAKEGFKLHKLITIPNTNRLPEEQINAQIKRLTAGSKSINMLTFNSNDSLSYWLKERKKPATMAVLNKADVKLDTLVKVHNEELKQINFNDELFVLYTKEKETEQYSNSNFYVSRALEMGNNQVSLIRLVEPPMLFFKGGNILNPRSFLLRGFWAYEKMADAVPMEFEPNP